MTTLQRSTLDSYVKSLEQITASACSYSGHLVHLTKQANEGVFDLDIFLDILESHVDNYGQVSSRLAKEFYETARKLTYPENYEALEVKNIKLKEYLRSQIEALPTDDERELVKQVRAAIDRSVKHYARDAIAYNCLIDQLKPRYARVPQGSHTCVFCLMLASRGAVYPNERAAGGLLNRYHPYCDCAIVPMFEGQTIEGYDPDGLYKRYQDCERAVRYAAEGLTGEDRTKLILAEMRRRDKDWLYSGKIPKVDISEYRKAVLKRAKKPASYKGDYLELLSKREKEVHLKNISVAQALAEHGIVMGIRDDITGATSDMRRPDALEISNNKLWEFKVVESSSDRALARNMYAKRQFINIWPNGNNTDGRIVIDGRKIKRKDDELVKLFKRRVIAEKEWLAEGLLILDDSIYRYKND